MFISQLVVRVALLFCVIGYHQGINMHYLLSIPSELWITYNEYELNFILLVILLD